MYTFSCPACDQALQVGAESLGKKISCSHCGQRLQLPTMAGNKTALVEPADLRRTPAPPPSSGSETYHLVQDGKRTGPFTLAALQGLAAAGALRATDNVLPSSSRFWVTADKIPNLFPAAAATGAAATGAAATGTVSNSPGLGSRLLGRLRGTISWLRVDRRRWMTLAGFSALFLVVLVVWFGMGKKRESSAAPGDQPAPAPEPLTGQQIYERALKATVWINNPGMGFGSGALINAEDKLVLTNYHVVFRPPSFSGGTRLQTLAGMLTNFDPRDPTLNLPYKVFNYQFQRGNIYVIDMESVDFDTYLQILTATGQVLAFDDDSGGNRNARIHFVPPNDGLYRIMATTFNGGVGRFTLKISQIDLKSAMEKRAQAVAPFLIVHFPAFDKGTVVSDKNHYVKLDNADKDKYKATVLAWSETKDLGLLKLSHVPAGVEALPLTKEPTRPGQAVHSIGNPGGSGALWVYTSGTVRTAAYQKQWQSLGMGGKMNHDARIIETQSPTNPGDSGGPLVNDKVELVAVTQGNNLNFNAISLFVDVEEVRSFLRSHKVRWVEK